MAREVFKIVDLVVTFQEEPGLDVYLVFELQDAKVKTSVRKRESQPVHRSHSTKTPALMLNPRGYQISSPTSHICQLQVFKNAGSQAGVRFTDNLMLPKPDWGAAAPPGADELLVCLVCLSHTRWSMQAMARTVGTCRCIRPPWLA